jgi:hypothetical protein
MKTQRFFIVGLVIVNLALIGHQFAQGKPDQSKDVTPIVRARAFEIVDDHGRVRAEIKVLPAQPDFKMPDGTKGYPETVQLRLISSQGAPNVKLGTTEDGAGLVTGGEAGYVQVLSRGTNVPFVKIVTKDGREQLMKP